MLLGNIDVYRMTSSLRGAPLSDTIVRARSFARGLGVTRVTEITRLDRIGIPVFASIRPTGLALCVNAGKGVHSDEAEAGAYMEAIEFAMAEYGRSDVRCTIATARGVLGGREHPDAILAFCPAFGAEIDLDAPLGCVEADEVVTSSRCLVPAELVFHPYHPDLGTNTYFGTSSNGLSSGNSVLEASIHGLAELIERDVQSFNYVRDRSVLVDTASLPPLLSRLDALIRGADLVLHLRYTESGFGLPYFIAYVVDPQFTGALTVSVGSGCHLLKEVAAARAICEAAQSRLAFIHGGRDDIIERYRVFDNADDEVTYTSRLVGQISNPDQLVRFDAIRDRAENVCDLPSAWKTLVDSLRAAGLRHICRVVLTRPDDPVHVVRTIVPGLESFDRFTQRVGPRLRDYAQASA
jgi:ribosomal protein S12 methylthiotransferase accessory factor